MHSHQNMQIHYPLNKLQQSPIRQKLPSYLLTHYTRLAVYAKTSLKALNAFECSSIAYSQSPQAAIITNLSRTFRQYQLHLQKVGELLVQKLQHSKLDRVKSLEKKIFTQINNLNAQLKQGTNNQNKFTQSYQNYQSACQRLDQTLAKLKAYSNPILFYNQSTSADSLKGLQSQYYSVTQLENSIKTDLKHVDQENNKIQEKLTEIIKAFTQFLDQYMFCIRFPADCCLEIAQEHAKPILSRQWLPTIGSMVTPLQEEENCEDFLQLPFQSRIKHTDSNLHQQDQNHDIVSDFKDLFSQVYPDRRSQFHSMLEAHRSLKVKTVEKMKEEVRIWQLIDNQSSLWISSLPDLQAIAREADKSSFGNDGSETFRKLFIQLFGIKMIEVFHICLKFVEHTTKSLEKVHREIKHFKGILSNILTKMKKRLSHFEQRAQQILSSQSLHQSMRYNEPDLVSQNSNHSLFQIYRQFYLGTEAQVKEDRMTLEKSVYNLAHLLVKVGIDRSCNHFLEKETARVQILKSLNIGKQVVGIIKEDPLYDRFFKTCAPYYPQFVSKINKDSYGKVKSLLYRKENTLRALLTPSQGCCGMRMIPVKHQVMAKMSSDIYFENEVVAKGKVKVLNQGVIFEEKSLNPFSQLLTLIIPQSDIISIQTSKEQPEGVIVSTDRGLLKFVPRSENTQSLEEEMRKHINFKARDDNDKRDKRNSSSTLPKQNSSIQYRISVDETVHLNSKTNEGFKSNSRPSQQVQTLLDFIKILPTSNLYSDNFQKISLPPNPSIKEKIWRGKYLYTNRLVKFSISERLQVLGESAKALQLRFDWKVTFPQFPLVKPFTNAQCVKIIDNRSTIKLEVFQSQRASAQMLLASKTFYSEITLFTNRLGELVHSFFKRSVDVVVSPQNLCDQEIPLSDTRTIDQNQ